MSRAEKHLVALGLGRGQGVAVRRVSATGEEASAISNMNLLFERKFGYTCTIKSKHKVFNYSWLISWEWVGFRWFGGFG